MNKAISILRAVLLIILGVVSVFLFAIAQGNGYHVAATLDFYRYPLYICIIIPIPLLYLTSKRFLPRPENQEFKLLALSLYVLLELLLIAYAFIAVMNS